MNCGHLRAFGVLLLLGCLAISLPGCSSQEGNVKNFLPGWQIIRPPNVVLALAIQGDTVWAGCKDGVYALDRRSGTIIKKLECNPRLTYAKALLVDQSGVLFIGHFNGLTRYDGNNYQTYTRKDGLPDNRVNALLQDHDGRLWVGTWGGLAILDNGEWHILTSADGLANDMVNVILQDSKGGMWFGSYVAPHGGISYLTDRKWQAFSTQNGLPHNGITSLFEDSSGSIWAGTGFYDRGGAARIVQTETGWAIQQVLRQQDGLAGEKVRSIFQDSDGVMWFSSEYDGLARCENGKWRVFTENEGLSHDEVMDMLQDVDGNLWCATYNGLTRLSAGALDALR